MEELYTIGHANHPVDTFLELLNRHEITALAGVRSSPCSKFNPKYNRENLKPVLTRAGIPYVYLQKALGPPSDDPSCYENGPVSCEKLARTDAFQAGLERLLLKGLKPIGSLSCAPQKDPTVCPG